MGDDETAIVNEFRNAMDAADIVLVTGGLGPTHDDVTRRCIVKFFETKLVFNEDVLSDVQNIFNKRGREVTGEPHRVCGLRKKAKFLSQCRVYPTRCK